MARKVDPTEYSYISLFISWIEFARTIFSNISSQSCSIEMDLSQQMSLSLGHEKNVIYSNLVNNPFKYIPILLGNAESTYDCVLGCKYVIEV